MSVIPSNQTDAVSPSASHVTDVDPGARAPLVLGGRKLHDVTRLITRIIEGKANAVWWAMFLTSASIATVGVVMIIYLIATGVGVWGLNQPVGWAFDITNFVFWVGIGHAGTLISAILFLLRQRWRTSINRAAEAMTIFAVICAGLFPLIHVGRIWRIYFVVPVPNHLGVWPNFRSPLLWDVFAVGTYATVSLMFWYVGLIPDLATLRDRATSKIKHIVYGLFALGWRGGQRQWRNYEMAYLLLAGLSTPLVLSVHSVVSFDFAVAQLPGWHTTIFPPYFVAGAIFSGFAMVITLLVPARYAFGLQDLITKRHLENMCKVLLGTGLIVAYSYGVEFFTAWYSDNPYESFVFFQNRALGPYAWAYWTMVTCNVLAPQLFWFKRVRRSVIAMFVVSIFVNIGMWFERFVIIVTSLHRDSLPSSWGYYTPTWVEILTLVGSFGIFLTLFLLFIRYLPMIAMSEVKTVVNPRDQVPATDHDREPRVVDQPAASDTSVSAKEKAKNVPPAGVIAEFDNPEALVRAATRVRDRGYKHFDVYSPFPIHGMEHAMGIRRSKLGWIVLVGGVVGALGALALQGYASAVDYPLITSGKPYFSWPAFVPIIFELGVLLAAFGAVFGMLALNGLPRWYHPLLKYDRFVRATDDSFFLAIDAKDKQFDADRAAILLEEIGGRNVEPLEP